VVAVGHRAHSLRCAESRGLVDDAHRPYTHYSEVTSDLAKPTRCQSTAPTVTRLGTGASPSAVTNKCRRRRSGMPQGAKPQTRNAGPAQPIHPRPWEGVLGRTPRPTRHALVSPSACGVLSRRLADVRLTSGLGRCGS
jgi:hypothetical protein